MFDPNHFGEGFQVPAIVTSVTTPTGCGHRHITVDLDGEAITVSMHTSETVMPNHKEMLVKAAIQRQLANGVTLSQLDGKGIF